MSRRIMSLLLAGCLLLGLVPAGAMAAQTEHSFGSWKVVTEATCTEKGLKERYCAHCGETEQEIIPLKDHDYMSDVIKPDYESGGYTLNICRECGHTYKSDITEPLQHDPKVLPARAPTCLNSGLTEGSYCGKCGVTLVRQRAIAPLGHDYETVHTDASCEAPARDTHTCTRCGDVEVERHGEALGHSFGQWQVTEPADCEKTGIRERKCQVCGKTETEEISQTHNYQGVITAPTCTEDGYTTYTCTLCGHVYVGSPVPARGHQVKIEVLKKATCTQAGIREYQCTACDDAAVNYKEKIPALGHDYKKKVTAPTCTKGGYTDFTCKVCDHSYRGDEVPAAGHTFGQWVNVKAPGCVTEGLDRRTCEVCGLVEEQVLAPFKHNYERTVVAPTCTKDGYTKLHCGGCGDTQKIDPVPALGHDYKNGVCANCGEKETQLKAPRITVTQLDSGKTQISWKTVSDAVKYKVYCAPKDGKFSLLTTTTGTRVNHTSAKQGVLYYYYVVAVGANGKLSPKSGEESGMWDYPAPTLKVTNNASTGKIKLSWTEVPDAVEYWVSYRIAGSDDHGRLALVKGTSLNHNSAKAGVKYIYSVAAVDKDEYFISEFAASKSRVCDLARPTVNVALTDSGKPRISWNKVAGAVKYQLYRSEDGKNFTRLTTTTKTAVTNTSAETGVTYTYKVRAVAKNTDGNSAYSETVSITAGLSSPKVSVTLTSAGKPSLSWKAVTGAESYTVSFRLSGGKWNTLKTTEELELVHSDAKAYKTYEYRVTANAGTASSKAGQVTIHTSTVGYSGSKLSRDLVNQINLYRIQNGKTVLKWDSAGETAARLRAAELRKSYKSLRPDGSYPGELWLTYGMDYECIAKGYSDEKTLVEDVMTFSPNMKSIFLDDSWTTAVAAYNGEYWSIMFGS